MKKENTKFEWIVELKHIKEPKRSEIRMQISEYILRLCKKVTHGPYEGKNERKLKCEW